jgi:hypothetical protein
MEISLSCSKESCNNTTTFLEYKFCMKCGSNLIDSRDKRHTIMNEISELGEFHYNTDSLYTEFLKRSFVLVLLFMILSISSFILAFFESLLQEHIIISFFLTMLNGAGNFKNKKKEEMQEIRQR